MSRRGLEVWRIDGDPAPLARDNTIFTHCFWTICVSSQASMFQIINSLSVE